METKMIQVLERTDEILSLLSVKGTLALKDIEHETKLKKTTLSNILKTLSTLGYVKKIEEGIYSLGNRVADLGKRVIKKQSVLSIADTIVHDLAEKTQEAGVVAMYEQGEILVIAKAIYEQDITVHANTISKYAPYGTVTGRTLVAHLPKDELGRFLKANGLPGKKWPGITSRTKLDKELAKIRKEQFLLRKKSPVTAMAVPIFGTDNAVWTSLGLCMPEVRFKGTHRKKVMEELKKAGERMTRLLAPV
jgi:IclR family pca regulon transcriptional regulator